MRIFEVNTPALEKMFLDIPFAIYKGCSQWRSQLGKDITAVFDRSRNGKYINGDAARWIILDENNHPSGRIAAFYFLRDGISLGQFGFFETVNNQELASALLNKAKEWLNDAGCEYMEGPVNFGEKDRFWGLLTKGFEKKMLYLDNYNHSYYVSLLLDYGFKPDSEISTYSISLKAMFSEKLERIHQRLLRNNTVEIRNINFGSGISDFVKDIQKIYAASFALNSRLNHISAEEIAGLITDARPVLDEELVSIAYCNGKAVGFMAFMKDFYSMLNIKNDNDTKDLKGFALSVIPEYRKRGIEIAMCYKLYRETMQKGTDYMVHFSGINSQTGFMHALMNSLGAVAEREHTTYKIQIN